ncbi:ParD-like family protein [Chromohalobacter nigrandesensis]|uniref:ParD-like family protein n=1 Tax=Chromohalobacter nigrandesensis TaxID=119863 RepID=UPI001FF22F50|nr:ParD-like family protein [Chromohalobacter nigrandesensis]MCK0746236.1 ParD-like family protein [Chromohalobacter nigrandesensis]
MSTSSVRLDQALIDKASVMGKAMNRSVPKQIEYWAKVGEIMEDNPDLSYEFVRQAIIAQAERDAGKLDAYEFD